MRGLLLVFYGDGKGKTTAAIGLAVRSIGHGMYVLFVQFIKRDLQVGEYRILKSLNSIRHVALGPGLGASREEVVECTRRGIELVSREWRNYDIIILDELGVAISKYEYPLEDVIQLVENIRSGGRHVVITGKYMPRELIDIADLVTEFRCVKHYYSQLRGPVPGLDL
ncbi:MAG: cob(I)yrinic acid a,c-diamide adenosyltransferase [Crenarchaeota archaeon]|nr:cob(I)yrinic acid a,c-diamide adenosyltransferase [Thermoproteota archaeon]